MAKMKEICRTAPLAGKRVALFVCGMEQDPAKRDQGLANAFPAALRAGAVAAAFLPGRFQLGAMSVAERFIIKRIAKTNQDVDAIDDAAIAAFAAEVA
jgi:hypothetical protein